MNFTTRKLIVHLNAKYGNITAGALEEKKYRMNTAYDTNHPSEALYTQLNQAVNFDNAASTLFTPIQIIVMAYNLVSKTIL